jgi:hypothetical protein
LKTGKKSNHLAVEEIKKSNHLANEEIKKRRSLRPFVIAATLRNKYNY